MKLFAKLTGSGAGFSSESGALPRASLFGARTVQCGGMKKQDYVITVFT